MAAEIVIDSSSSSSSSFDEYLILDTPQSDIFRYARRLHKISMYGYTLYTPDLLCLMDREWLNDNIVNTYFRLIVNREEKVFAFSSYAYPSLRETPAERAATWYGDIDFSSYDYLLFPIFEHSHWSLIVVDGLVLRNYDSLGRNTRMIANKALYTVDRFLKALYAHARKASCTFESREHIEFSWRDMSHSIPQQTNSDDCGVFCCMYARFFVDKKVSGFFLEKSISVLRRRMLHEIMAGEIIYEYNRPKES